MKNLFKSLSVICLALVLLCPLALVGCSKNYTINISIVEGSQGGYVYMKNINGVSVLGDNTVKSGDKFEYFVTPKDGYVISKILVDGKPQTDFDAEKGSYLYFEDVKKDHKVKVYFKAKTYVVSLYCKVSPAGGEFELFKTVDVEYGSALNLNNYGGEQALWFVRENNVDTYLFDESDPDSNLLFVLDNVNVYCNKTAQDLEDMGVER